MSRSALPSFHGEEPRVLRAPAAHKRASKRGPQCSAPGDERASVPGPVVPVGGRCCTRPPSRSLLEEDSGADRSLPKGRKGVDK